MVHKTESRNSVSKSTAGNAEAIIELRHKKVFSFFGWRATSGLLNRCFGMPELNSRDAMGCLRGFKQALQSDVMGISSVSRPKRNEISSLRVDMGNPGVVVP